MKGWVGYKMAETPTITIIVAAIVGFLVLCIVGRIAVEIYKWILENSDEILEWIGYALVGLICSYSDCLYC